MATRRDITIYFTEDEYRRVCLQAYTENLTPQDWAQKTLAELAYGLRAQRTDG